MNKEGTVEWMDSQVKTSVVVYWKKPAEWAEAIYAWIENTGQKGSVLTVYEILHGEGTLSEEFHDMHPVILRKALTVLVKRGMAQTMGQDDEMGVKFF